MKKMYVMLLVAAMGLLLISCGATDEKEVTGEPAVVEEEPVVEEESTDDTDAVSEEVDEPEEEPAKNNSTTLEVSLNSENSEKIFTIVGENDMEEETRVDMTLTITGFSGEYTDAEAYAPAYPSDSWGKGGTPTVPKNEFTVGTEFIYDTLYPHADLECTLPVGFSEMSYTITLKPQGNKTITVTEYGSYDEVPQSFYDELNAQI